MTDTPQQPETFSPVPPAPPKAPEVLAKNIQNKTGMVVVDGVSYAVGLLWQPLQNPDDPNPEIREAIESESGYDLYCIRASSAPQYALGRSDMGHRVGAPSLAASVAYALSTETSVCAVFKLDEGWWFIAIRNDLILSEEDVLFKTEEEAQKAFMSMMAVPDWDMRVVPAEWRIDGAVQKNLTDLVRNTPKIRLSELSPIKKTQILILLSLLILSIMGGLIYMIISLWKIIGTAEPIPQIREPQKIEAVQPAPEKPKPWERIVDLDVFINKCWNNSYQLSVLTIPGWTLGNVVCTPDGIATGWTKNAARGSRLTYLKKAIEEYKLAVLSIALASGGTSASGQIKFTNLPLVPSLPTLTPEQLQEQLTDIVQASAIPLQFSQQTVQDPPTPPGGEPPPGQQTFTFFSFSVASMYSPWEWKTFFDKFSGLELTKIEYNPSVSLQNKWKYEGKIYAK
ncbi:MAG: type 4b pilus protein PilO2 [Alphaproteobacteria bacterium]|nr:type 4b pilus protein PilO2 [Alphaproteobacteria bacterium]